ncbi:DUF2599 domain-containing protein [Microbacterium helvum]|uniref:DUF2599 domain-containing protein n=1 Tax=Microbacterium helvum TaxID=2773713 RepID=UPI0029640FE6|nr:DUF2599 domain-containing protein [Microbacterium helvum]
MKLLNLKRLIGATVATAISASLLAVASPQIASAADDTGNSASTVAIGEPATVTADQLPPRDDPQAVVAYLAELSALRSTGVTGAAANICINSVSLEAVSLGTIVHVYKKSSASEVICNRVAQSVYDNEYKPLVASQYEGNKYRDQLVCHIGFAWGKTPWNLDSWRPDVGYPATVAASCNP